MGTLKFAVNMLKKEYKKSFVYTLTLCLTIAVTFLFFNIIDNKYLVTKVELASSQQLTIPFSSTLSFVIIVFCGFMIIFASNFYISRKTKEIAIMEMSGSSFIGATMYLFYQNLIMSLIAFPLGIVLGSGISMFVNQLIYQYLSYQVPFFYIPYTAILDTVICIVVIIVAQLIYASGFVYRKDIQYMLSQEGRNNAVDQRMFKLPPVIYSVIYLLGIILLITTPYESTSAIVPCCIGAVGISGIVKYCLGNFFRRRKWKRYLADKIQLISISNLQYSLNRAIFLIGIYAISTNVMIAIMISQQENPREMMTAIIGFIVVILLLLASIMYKYIMEASTRRMFYYNLYKLGYSYHQLLQIIRKEVFSFYVILIGLPFVYTMIALIQSYIHEGIALDFIIVAVLTQMIPAVLAGIFTYVSYKNSVLQVLKEGVRYE